MTEGFHCCFPLVRLERLEPLAIGFAIAIAIAAKNSCPEKVLPLRLPLSRPLPLAYAFGQCLKASVLELAATDTATLSASSCAGLRVSARPFQKTWGRLASGLPESLEQRVQTE